MKMLLGMLVGFGMLTWAAGAAPRSAAEKSARLTATAPVERVTATAPADGARPMVPPRKRLLEGPVRAAPGPPGGPGRRFPDKAARPGAGPGPGADEPLPPPKVEEMMQFARENFPEIHRRLERLRQVDPPEFQRMLRKIRGRMLPLIETGQRDRLLAQKMIEEYRAQMAVMDLAEQYRRSRSDAQRSRLRDDLEAMLRRRFEHRQERARLEIENLRRRLDEQERLLADREDHKEALLRREFERAVSAPIGPGVDRGSEIKPPEPGN